MRNPPETRWTWNGAPQADSDSIGTATPVGAGAAAVALTVLGLNMFGDALRDALDPRSKGGV